MYFVDFNQLPTLFDNDVSLLTFAFNIVVNFFKMTAEAFIGVDDSKFTRIPTDFSVFGLPIPHLFSNKKVIVFDLSSERCRWNIENGLSSIEIVKVSCDLITGDPP